MPQDYNKTLNLPKTNFPMRAGLPQMEPKVLEQWEQSRIYYKMVENNKGRPLYVFHDGPPYANASIHLGTALNKVLKDIIVRHRNMTGYLTNYIPGWDTHGLPIEHKAIIQEGLSILSNPLELRQRCRDFALFHVECQKKEFKRLGAIGDYEYPYLTLRPEYESKQIDIFGAMAKKGYIYKDLKSVYWCPECVTALAEAEIEYAEDACDSVYVKFEITKDQNGVLGRMGMKDMSRAYLLIWTTTTWTLPANMVTCLGPEIEYVLVQAGEEQYLLAKNLVEEVMGVAGVKDYAVLGSAMGKELEFVEYAHPFLPRTGKVLLGDHVTLDSGTGCVHTAPGHGVEDFEICAQYGGIEVVVPVDKNGKMTDEAGDFVTGLSTWDANPVIVERLRDSGHLLAVRRFEHTYPHCWRCKQPVLFRATNQWFCSVEDFKDETIEAINEVRFIPEWGRDRMAEMVRGRSAWCISRQRIWGVPIPVFYCDDCEGYTIDDDTIAAVSALFKAEGADAWYAKSAAEILPEGYACPKCGGKTFTKETDIMDVWFDSGVSHAAVLEGAWEDQTWPCDLYLEGTDQYRGWFQSSLLTSVAWRNTAPYKAVCTHGWVVDGEGKKMSKSLGNGIEPGDIIGEYGADILRLWVASSDYHADVRISKDILGQMSEIYRKIRNTARYILGNLHDFEPDQDGVCEQEMPELDRWALARLDWVLERVHRAYEDFDFHIVFHTLHNFCTVDLSNFYLDILKDRLYVEKADSKARRSAQTAMHRILRALDLMLAPIIPFTAEEIWGFMPASEDYDSESVILNLIPRPSGKWGADFLGKWEKIIAARDTVNKALEQARTQKAIGKSLEAKVVLRCQGELYDLLEKELPQLATIFIVSQVELQKGGAGDSAGDIQELQVEVLPADGDKCERCWCYSTAVGQNPAHPGLCGRCAAIVG